MPDPTILRWPRAAGVFMAAICVLGAASCGGVGEAPRGASVRIVNGLTEDVSLDVTIAGRDVIQGLERWASTTYATVPHGAQPVAVRRSGETSPIHEAILAFVRDGRHTLIAFGATASLGMMVLEDPAAPPAAGASRVRFVHAYPAGPSLDLFLLRPGQTLADAQAVVTGLAPRAASEAMDYPAGEYRMQIVRSGTTDSLVGGEVTLPPGAGRTIAVIEAPSLNPPVFALVVADGG
jgi:hypothetical protein